MSRAILTLLLATVVATGATEFGELFNQLNTFNLQLCNMRNYLLGDSINNLPPKVCNYSAHNYANIEFVQRKLFDLMTRTSRSLRTVVEDLGIPKFSETFGPLNDDIFRDRAIVFDNIDQLYKNAMDVTINSTSVTDYTERLLEMSANVNEISRNNSERKTINDILRRIYSSIFKSHGTENDFLASLHQQCQGGRCNTIQSLDQLKTVYESLLAAELKTIIAGIHFDLAHDFFTNYYRRVLDFMKFVIPSALERIQNYILSSEHLARNIQLKYCQPFSWMKYVTTRQDIYPSTHDRSLNFATITLHQKIELAAFTETRNFLRIWFNDSSVSVSYNGRRVHNGIHKKIPSNGYWIRWNENSMSLGQFGMTEPLLTHIGDDYRELTFFNTVSGRWIFYDLPPRSRQEEQKIRNCWAAPLQPLVNSIIPGNICRIRHNSEWIPGYYNQSEGLCYGADKTTNTTLSSSNFHVLMKPTRQQWVNVDSTNSPETAVLGGIGEIGEPRFICRSKCQSRIGYVDPIKQNCIYNQDTCTDSVKIFRILLQDN